MYPFPQNGFRTQAAIQRRGIGEGIGEQARNLIITGIQPGRHQGGRVSRSPGAGLMRFEQVDRQPQLPGFMDETASGNTGANNGELFGTRHDLWCLAHENRLQSFTFTAKSRAFFDSEARRLKPAPDKTRHRKGGQSCAGFRLPGYECKDIIRPHIGIERRRKTIEKDGVGLSFPCRQGRADIHQAECQADAPLREIHIMKATPNFRPLRQQRLDKKRQFRP